MKTTIKFESNESSPVYLKYGGQHQPQDAYLEMDEEGNIDAGYCPDPGNNTTTFDVHHRRTFRWAIPSDASGDGILECIEYIREDLDALHANHTTEWDGSNYVGKLSEDGYEIYLEIDRKLSDWTWGRSPMWDPSDWFGALGTDDFREMVVPAGKSEEEIRQIAKDLDEEDDGEKIVWTSDLAEYLIERHNDLTDEEGAQD